jgi:exodeoxyribonuclease III
MRVITWNVNSIKIRLERLLALLQRHNPDVVCLQEIKTIASGFPSEQIQALGYNVALHGQKTYNGVAILAKSEISDLATILPIVPGAEEDPQARFICGTINGVRILNGYFPNGSEITSDKFAYKLQWLDRLVAHVKSTYSPTQPLLLCGDFNVAHDDLDVAFPEMWDNSVLTHETARNRLRALQAWGLRDVFREKNPKGKIYSWWDYRQLAFPKGDGLRIDHIYMTPPIADKTTAVTIDREERKGQQPSDHAPVIVDFDI